MLVADRIYGVVTVLVGAVAMFQALSMSILSDGVPGPGLLPLVVGLALIALGVVPVVSPQLKRGEIDWPPPTDRWRLIGSFGALVLYTTLLPVLGFLVVTTVFLTGMVWWWGQYRWWVAMSLGALPSVSMFLIFQVWLGLPLPEGVWG